MCVQSWQDHYLGLLEKNGFFLEGWVFCEFSREPVFNQPELGRVFNLAEDHYHILLARAPTMGTYKNKETNTTCMIQYSQFCCSFYQLPFLFFHSST